MNNYRDATSPTFAAPRRLRMALLTALLLLTGLVIAGCGSSGESSTITIGNESKSAGKLITAGATSTTPKTPTSGPLATKPAVAAGKGPAPAKLVSKDLVVGTGAEAKNGSTVYVNYVGGLWKNGKEFDSSWKRNEPFTFTIGGGQVIKGWDKGVVGMKVGGRRELQIPSEEGYGKLGSPPSIPKNEALIFVIDLLKA